MSSWSLVILRAAAALLVVDAMRLNTQAQVGLQSDPPEGRTRPAWVPISTTKACIVRQDEQSRRPDHQYENYTLEMCKSACDADYYASGTDDGCIAIDYFSVSRECYLYTSACSFPLYEKAGASSYGRQAPCDGHSCPSGYALKSNAYLTENPQRTSATATCCERAWIIIGTNAACLTNSEDIHPIAIGTSIPKLTLEMCRARCNANNRCVAIDFFSIDGECVQYDKACAKPLAAQEGASSYMHQTTCDAYRCPPGYSIKAGARYIVGQGRDPSACCETICHDYRCPPGHSLKVDAWKIKGQGRDPSACCDTTCHAYRCPPGHSLKVDAWKITGQGRDPSTCCEAGCPATDCACVVHDTVIRNSAWRRWDGAVCKCKRGSSLRGDSKVCTGRHFDPAKLQGKGCICAAV